MPRYSYHCEACETTSSMFHSISTVVEECPLCLETYENKTKINKEPKEKVEEHIQSAREELKQQIKDLKNEDMVD